MNNDSQAAEAIRNYLNSNEQGATVDEIASNTSFDRGEVSTTLKAMSGVQQEQYQGDTRYFLR